MIPFRYMLIAPNDARVHTANIRLFTLNAAKYPCSTNKLQKKRRDLAEGAGPQFCDYRALRVDGEQGVERRLYNGLHQRHAHKQHR